MKKHKILERVASDLSRISLALEALAGNAENAPLALGAEDAYFWDAERENFTPVVEVNRVPLRLLRGIDSVRDPLLANTEQFARGYGANNVLLWGARGMGKSSLIKAVHAHINAEADQNAKRLVLVEINREDLGTLPHLLRAISTLDERFLVYCDDLSFDRDEASYKALKSALDGGLEGRPKNVLFYATSNRRHLMPRDMIENERSTAISPSEAIEEKVSLSDRFGLWLGFHSCDQDTYLEIVRGYVAHYELEIDETALAARAIEWAALRGARSGRVAIQFVHALAGQSGRAV